MSDLRSELETPCPACGAAAGFKCHTVIDGEDVGWTHDARILAPVISDLLARHPEPTADRDELAELLVGHGFTYSDIGGVCPGCDHVYFEKPRGAYMDPDLDWLDGAIKEHRADAIIAAGWVKA